MNTLELIQIDEVAEEEVTTTSTPLPPQPVSNPTAELNGGQSNQEADSSTDSNSDEEVILTSPPLPPQPASNPTVELNGGQSNQEADSYSSISSDAEAVSTEEAKDAEEKEIPTSPSLPPQATSNSTAELNSEQSTSSDTVDESTDKLSIYNLKVGQHIVGKVKNITKFGAFVDIGIPQDGLVHISKLSRHKVAKVTDVVSKGQEVEVWVQKVDKKRGRLSLTMVKPIKNRMRNMKENDELEGVVTRLESYGSFIDVGSERDGLVHISQITHKYIKHPEEALKIGDKVNVKILKVDYKKRQVDLSIKDMLEPPEPPQQVSQEQVFERKMKQVASHQQQQPKAKKWNKKQNRRTSKQKAKKSFFIETTSVGDPMPTAFSVAYAALQNKAELDDGNKGVGNKSRKNQEMDDIVTRTLASQPK